MFRLIPLLILFVYGQAWAATWYVDCSAGVNGAGSSFVSPFNAGSSVNWATIAAGDDDVLFRAGVTCNNSKLGAAAGWPNASDIAGSPGDYIRIGVYDPATGAEILTPTAEQRAVFAGDGTTRTEMISLFGFSYTVVNGIDISGGSFGSQRGELSIGAGVAASNNIIVSNCKFSQGLTPATAASAYAVQVAGLATAGGDLAISFINNDFYSIPGTSTSYNILVSNADGVTIQNNTMRATASGSINTGHVLAQTTTDSGHFALDRLTIKGNTMTGGRESIRHTPFGGTSQAMSISNVVVRNNTISNLTHHAVRLSLPKGGVVEGNTITDVGSAGGYQAAPIYVATSGALFTGADDFDGFAVRNNRMTGVGTYGVWVIGANDFVIEDNYISSCGNPNVSGATSYGRCIELTRSDTGGVTRRPAVAATLSGTTGSVTLTATGALVAADLNRLVMAPRENEGICKVTAVTPPNTATCDVLRTFSVTTLPSGDWVIGQLTHSGAVRGNTIREAYGRQYSVSPGTEGIGIGLDDLTSLMTVEGNDIADTDYIGIEVNSGRGNSIRSNIIARAGRDDTYGTATFIRRAGIIDKGAGQNSYFNNSINCDGNAYGISFENTTTGATDDIANGGVSEARNNVIMNCSQAGLLMNANDLASNNSFFSNAANYVWMAYLSFSGEPIPANLTAQVLDGASKITDPKLLGGSAPTTALGFTPLPTSPLLGAGTPTSAKYDFYNLRIGIPPCIGAICTSSNKARSSFSYPRND